MDLPREQDPKPIPLEPTGAYDKRTKIKIFGVVVAIVFFSLMLVGWFISRPSTVMERRPMSVPTKGDGNSSPQYPKISPQKEAEANSGKQVKPFVPSQPSGTLGRPRGREFAESGTAEKKKTPKEEYEDLLRTASLAGSRVEGGSNGSSDNSIRTDDRNSGTDDIRADVRQPVSLRDDSAGARLSGPVHKGPQEIAAGVLPAGWFIRCVLVNQLSGEYTGPVKVQIANDIYYPDTTDLAIPQGAIFLGEAQKVSGAFQQRLAVSFNILQYRRDGKLYQVALDKLPGLDQQGATALKDKVDNHYLQIFGAAFAIGAIGGLAQIGNSGYGGISGVDPSVAIRNGVTQQMAQNSAQILNRFLNRMPTITIRPGTPVVVYFPYGVDLQ